MARWTERYESRYNTRVAIQKHKFDIQRRTLRHWGGVVREEIVERRNVRLALHYFLRKRLRAWRAFMNGVRNKRLESKIVAFVHWVKYVKDVKNHYKVVERWKTRGEMRLLRKAVFCWGERAASWKVKKGKLSAGKEFHKITLLKRGSECFATLRVAEKSKRARELKARLHFKGIVVRKCFDKWMDNARISLVLKRVEEMRWEIFGRAGIALKSSVLVKWRKTIVEEVKRRKELEVSKSYQLFVARTRMHNSDTKY